MDLDILRTVAYLIGFGLIMALGVLVIDKVKQRKMPLFSGVGDLVVSSMSVTGIVLQFAYKGEGKIWYMGVGVLLLVCLGCLFKLFVTPFKNNKIVSCALCSLLGRIVVASLSAFVVAGILGIGVILYSKFILSLNIKFPWKYLLLGVVPLGIVGSCLDYDGAMNAARKEVEGSVYARHKKIILLGYAAISDMILLMVLSKL